MQILYIFTSLMSIGFEKFSTKNELFLHILHSKKVPFEVLATLRLSDKIVAHNDYHGPHKALFKKIAVI